MPDRLGRLCVGLGPSTEKYTVQLVASMACTTPVAASRTASAGVPRTVMAPMTMSCRWQARRCLVRRHRGAAAGSTGAASVAAGAAVAATAASAAAAVVAGGAADVLPPTSLLSAAYCANAAGCRPPARVAAALSAAEPAAGWPDAVSAAAPVSATFRLGWSADSVAVAPAGTETSVAENDWVSSPVELSAAMATTPTTNAAATPVTRR